MLSGARAGSSMISAASAGRSSHDHRPNSASQMRVKARLRSRPPAARTKAHALRMCAASGASPASRSAA
jgi:hypothetical protein